MSRVDPSHLVEETGAPPPSQKKGSPLDAPRVIAETKQPGGGTPLPAFSKSEDDERFRSIRQAAFPPPPPPGVMDLVTKDHNPAAEFVSLGQAYTKKTQKELFDIGEGIKGLQSDSRTLLSLSRCMKTPPGEDLVISEEMKTLIEKAKTLGVDLHLEGKEKLTEREVSECRSDLLAQVEQLHSEVSIRYGDMKSLLDELSQLIQVLSSALRADGDGKRSIIQGMRVS